MNFNTNQPITTTTLIVTSAAELGAPHQRKRIFIVAHRNDLSLRERKSFIGWEEQIGEHVAIARNYPHAQSQRWETGLQLGETRRHQFNGILAGNTAECQQRNFEGTASSGNLTRTVGKCLSMGMMTGFPLNWAESVLMPQLGSLGLDDRDGGSEMHHLIALVLTASG